MVIIVSTDSDEHAQAVIGELKRMGTPYTLLDLGRFPREMQLSLGFEPGGLRDFSLLMPDGSALDLNRCRSIWWRRPQGFELHPEIKKDSHRHFAMNESWEAFTGLWNALDPLWINPPANDERAHRKVFQLKVAQEAGLVIPRTLVTNNPGQAQSFALAQGYDKTVYKAFSATETDWRETRVLKQEEVELLDNVGYAPVIFQEYIPAIYDLRITVIGDDVFPAAIYSQQTSYKIDFRMDIANARIEAVTIPTDVKAKLLALMKTLGLVYGAVDFRLTPDGQYVFLEINPAGQWLFIEMATRQPMTACLAKLLTAGKYPD